MFRRALALVLAGILLVGATTVVYGTYYDKGFAESVKSVVGAGDKEHDDHPGRDRSHGEDHDD